MVQCCCLVTPVYPIMQWILPDKSIINSLIFFSESQLKHSPTLSSEILINILLTMSEKSMHFKVIIQIFLKLLFLLQ